MADYRFPNVSFDWLGELPGLAEEAEGRRNRKTALADLNSSDPGSLRAVANQLFKTGNPKNMELALRLHQTALGRETLGQKGAELAAYQKLMSEGGGFKPFGGGPTAPAAPPDSGYVDINAGQGGQAAPSPFDAAPTRGLQVPTDRRGPGPGAALPPDLGSTPAAAEQLQRVAALGGAPTGLTGSGAPPPALPPSEALLAQAEGPAPQQLAQGPSPSMLDAARIPIGPPPAPPARPQQPPAGSPDRQRAQAEAEHWASEYAKLGPKSQNTPLGQALKANLTKALSIATPDKDIIHWNIENAQRRQDREPPISFPDFMNENKTVEERYKNSSKAYSKYHEDESKARDLLNSIGPMQAIVDHPDFASGKGTKVIAQFKSGLVGLAKNAESLGVPVERYLPKGWQNIQDTTKLQEVFTALSNQAIYAKLGTLGNQISTGDLKFVIEAFPSLSTTPEGNRLLLRILRETAVHAVSAGEKAREYMQSKETRATPHGLHAEVQKWADANALFMDKHGNLTERGKALVAQGVPAPGGAQTPAAPAPAAPPVQRAPAGRPVQGPDGKRYRQLPGGQLVPEEPFDPRNQL